MQVKECSGCKLVKDFSDFNYHPNGRFKLQARCKLCIKAYDKARRDTDEYRTKHALEEKIWRKENPELHQARVKKNRESIRASSRECGRRWRAAEPERHLWYKTKHSAKKKGIDHTIEVSDIVIPRLCPVLGIPLVTGAGSRSHGFNPNLANVDRIDNTKGYIKGNICVISSRANRIKSDATLEEIRAIERYLAEALEPKPNQDTET